MIMIAMNLQVLLIVLVSASHSNGTMLNEKMDDAQENYKAHFLIGIESAKRPFISLEPLLGSVEYRTLVRMNLIIVGAMTGPGATPPQTEWIESIKRNVPAAKLFWKSNIRKYL